MKINLKDIAVILPAGAKVTSAYRRLSIDTQNGDTVDLYPSFDGLDVIDEIPAALPEIKPLLAAVVQKLLDDDQKFNAIKAVKDATGCGLKSAKLFVDGFFPTILQPTITERVKELLNEGRYDDAFYLFRDYVRCDSESAYAFINSLAPKPLWLQDVESLILNGSFIDAVKLYRKSTDTSLLDAKNACDLIRNHFREQGRMK